MSCIWCPFVPAINQYTSHTDYGCIFLFPTRVSRSQLKGISDTIRCKKPYLQYTGCGSRQMLFPGYACARIRQIHKMKKLRCIDFVFLLYSRFPPMLISAEFYQYAVNVPSLLYSTSYPNISKIAPKSSVQYLASK